MSRYTIDICFQDYHFQGTISCDADWDCQSDTVEWCGPYRRVDITTDLVDIQNIRILDIELTTPEYDSYLYCKCQQETRIWQHFLNQNIDNGLLGILEESICENHDIMEEQSE